MEAWSSKCDFGFGENSTFHIEQFLGQIKGNIKIIQYNIQDLYNVFLKRK